jgi:hypothetical protein
VVFGWMVKLEDREILELYKVEFNGLVIECYFELERVLEIKWGFGKENKI